MTIKWRLLTTILASFLLLPLFHNCGQFSPASKFEKLDSTDGGGGGGGGGVTAACLSDMLPVFQQTYHKFFTTPANMCSSCHTPGGLAAHVPFGQPSAAQALTVFADRFDIRQAPDRIFNKLKNGHFGPTFSNVESSLEGFKRDWNQGLQSSDACAAGSLITNPSSFAFFDPVFIGGEETTDVTVKVPLRPADVWQKITWKLADLSQNNGLADVEFSVELRADPAPEIFIPTRYLARNLKITTPSKNVYVRNIALLLNGKTYFTTTYSGVDKVIEANAAEQIVMQASTSFYVKDNGEKYRNDDAWTLEIEEVREATEADLVE